MEGKITVLDLLQRSAKRRISNDTETSKLPHKRSRLYDFARVILKLEPSQCFLCGSLTNRSLGCRRTGHPLLHAQFAVKTCQERYWSAMLTTAWTTQQNQRQHPSPKLAFKTKLPATSTRPSPNSQLQPTQYKWVEAKAVRELLLETLQPYTMRT